MDRNKQIIDLKAIDKQSLSARRAWIEIDWASVITAMTSQSLSARRAWIEMSGHRQAHTSPTVSLSARRAWIEIRLFVWIAKRALVALRKESVDRNCISGYLDGVYFGRSPQGERG